MPYSAMSYAFRTTDSRTPRGKAGPTRTTSRAPQPVRPCCVQRPACRAPAPRCAGRSRRRDQPRVRAPFCACAAASSAAAALPRGAQRLGRHAAYAAGGRGGGGRGGSGVAAARQSTIAAAAWGVRQLDDGVVQHNLPGRHGRVLGRHRLVPVRTRRSARLGCRAAAAPRFLGCFGAARPQLAPRSALRIPYAPPPALTLPWGRAGRWRAGSAARREPNERTRAVAPTRAPRPPRSARAAADACGRAGTT